MRFIRRFAVWLCFDFFITWEGVSWGKLLGRRRTLMMGSQSRGLTRLRRRLLGAEAHPAKHL
jgi:hypothetical protein